MQLLAPFMLRKNRRVLNIVTVVVAVVCLVVLLAQTVFAQNTYVITDGDQVKVYTSYASDPQKILDEAGFQLDEDDYFTTQVTDGVSEITVQRAHTVKVNYCGEWLQVTGYAETVEALLGRMGIPTSGDYSYSLPLDTMTCEGMELTVDYVVSGEQAYTLAIPYETVRIDDPTLPAGYEKVLVAGEAGQKLCSAEVVYVNTQEQSRNVVKETVLQEPVDRVVAVGTGEELGKDREEPLIGDGIIVLPTGEVLTYTSVDQYVATAYTMTDEGCDEYTATGSLVHVGVVAVDTKLIPYGTRMFIVTNDGEYIYGVGTAEDCGSSIKGKRLDLYFDTDPECWEFGIRDCTVYFLGKANWK